MNKPAVGADSAGGGDVLFGVASPGREGEVREARDRGRRVAPVMLLMKSGNFQNGSKIKIEIIQGFYLSIEFSSTPNDNEK